MSYAAATKQRPDDGRGGEGPRAPTPTKALRWSGLDSTPVSIGSRLEAQRPPLALSTMPSVVRGRTGSALPAPPPSARLAAPHNTASLASRAVQEFPWAASSMRAAASSRPSMSPSGATSATTRSPASPNPLPLSPNAGRGRQPLRGLGARGRSEASWQRFYDATREQKRRELAAKEADALRRALAPLASAPDPMRV